MPKYLPTIKMQLIPLAELDKADKLIHILEIILTIFKYLPVIIGIFASISIVLAIMNFIDRSYMWGVINLILGLSGLWFVARVSRSHRHHFDKPAELVHETADEVQLGSHITTKEETGYKEPKDMMSFAASDEKRI